ncbi:MAG: exo-alpha-sialidase [Akkermansiaceae bacterium]|nr:exo-alpha-sialidase [Akkermansiaceae bacterium]
MSGNTHKCIGLFLLVASQCLNADVPGTRYAWYKADAGVTVDADSNVVGWVDQVAGGQDLDRVIGTPGTVTLGRSGGGTVGVVSFDGASALWASAGDWGSVAGNRTVVLHCRLSGAVDGFLFDGSTNPGKTRAQVRSGFWQAGVQDAGASFGSADPDTTVISVDTWQTHMFTYAESGGSTQVTHYIDGSQVGTHAVAVDTSLGGLILASNGGTGGKLAYELAEVIVYARSLDVSERSDVVSYMEGRWGDLIDLPIVYQSATTIQNPGNVSIYGFHGIAALAITSTGNAPAYALTALEFNLGGTTDTGDIDEIRLYSSGDSAVFDPSQATLIDTILPPFSGTMSFNIRVSVTHAETHFWVAVKMSGDSALGDVLDAEITGFTIDGADAGTYTPAVTAPAGALTINSQFFSTIVRAGGDDGVAGFRIPGLATTGAGTLVAVFDIRHDGFGDLPGNIDVGAMRSTDGGLTWSTMITVMDYDENVPGSFGNGVGDPSILVDKNTGRIWCAALWSKGNNGWSGSGSGLTPDETGQYVLNYSDDDGVTWSAPVSITSQIKNAAWKLYFQGPGKGICMRDGTLVFPSQYRDAGGTPRSNFIYSTDGGVTWANSTPAIPSGSPWTTESQIVEQDDGNLLISMRNHDGSKRRLWCVYSWNHDTETIADGSWGTAWYDQTDPTVMASVERYRSKLDGHPYSALLFSNPDNTNRSKMSIRLSLDEGLTWPYKRKIDDRPAAYSCMTILPDGHIGIFYETGSSSSVAQMEFARFPLVWLVGDTDTDSDQIPDFYEDAVGLEKHNGADASLDPDLDGMSNLDEYRAQTHPLDNESVLTASIQKTESGLVLTWSSVPFLSYRVEGSETMAEGTWEVVPGMSEIKADGVRMSITLPAATGERNFYRVVTQRG